MCLGICGGRVILLIYNRGWDSIYSLVYKGGNCQVRKERQDEVEAEGLGESVMMTRWVLTNLFGLSC